MSCEFVAETKVKEVVNEDSVTKEIKIKDRKEILNVDKTHQIKTTQTESNEKTVEYCNFQRDFDLGYQDSVIVKFFIISTCLLCYLAYINLDFNLYIPDGALLFGIGLPLVTVFVFGASYLYTLLMSEKFLRITLRDKLAAAQIDEFIKQMRTINDDLAELTLMQQDECVRLMVANNEEIIRLNSAETDEKIRMLASKNDQQMRLSAAKTDERIRLMTEGNDKYKRQISPKCDSDVEAPTENKNEVSNYLNDLPLLMKELGSDCVPNIDKKSCSELFGLMSEESSSSESDPDSETEDE